jgi:histidine ammonia-lyase
MGGQFMATSLTAEIRQMCTPMSIQSLPSTGDFQDHVSFGLNAARRTRDILQNCYYILAFELICAAQAVEIRGLETLSTATRLMHGIVRQTVPYFDFDTPLTDYIEGVAALFESGELLKALPKDSRAYDW